MWNSNSIHNRGDIKSYRTYIVEVRGYPFCTGLIIFQILRPRWSTRFKLITRCVQIGLYLIWVPRTLQVINIIFSGVCWEILHHDKKINKLKISRTVEKEDKNIKDSWKRRHVIAWEMKLTWATNLLIVYVPIMWNIDLTHNLGNHVPRHNTQVKHRAVRMSDNKPHDTPICEKKLFLEAQHEHVVAVHRSADCSKQLVEMKPCMCHTTNNPAYSIAEVIRCK
jgi:hypothetical protein